MGVKNALESKVLKIFQPCAPNEHGLAQRACSLCKGAKGTGGTQLDTAKSKMHGHLALQCEFLATSPDPADKALLMELRKRCPRSVATSKRSREILREVQGDLEDEVQPPESKKSKKAQAAAQAQAQAHAQAQAAAQVQLAATDPNALVNAQNFNPTIGHIQLPEHLAQMAQQMVAQDPNWLAWRQAANMYSGVDPTRTGWWGMDGLGGAANALQNAVHQMVDMQNQQAQQAPTQAAMQQAQRNIMQPIPQNVLPTQHGMPGMPNHQTLSSLLPSASMATQFLAPSMQQTPQTMQDMLNAITPHAMPEPILAAPEKRGKGAGRGKGRGRGRGRGRGAE